jgi:polysaccharide deacetylase 2 family uncharacterized protein YibQ
MVSVQIEQAGEGHTVVDIASRPRLRIIIDDWGKNKDNVERIAAFLQSEAAKAS